MPLHFVDPTAGALQPGELLVLTGAEAHHAAVVRRIRVGEEVTVGDGAGTWLTGTCESASSREVEVRVTGRRDVPASSPRLVLVQALAKGDRDELAVQAATELGVDEIVPWQAARSVSRWEGMKAEKGRARWEAIVREAAKQAHRPWIPQVSGLTRTAQLAERAASALVVVLEPSAEEALTGLAAQVRDADEIVLVVGPEGGIATEELQALQSAGARIARLGTEVLRTSTAGPAALAAVAVALGRW
ncbi:MAG: 16S rRNA (uracil(1498)-N(3))-methyltransferase [Microbacterium sp.]|uniref:16S rRNA (uracil(1498)-N(3))-methyltransferase n=1 Tax=Microbacterium sp. TaxID=51671 RepID=UPI002638DA2B|nr:16S rRNA (uracil(1498)-N(3))-methyltransferase [Microbacterium sp.]MCX6500957.1 16S rRNA (uracil(1498)-N(3))-methyltransferase [Microbacterium sp.]